MLRVVAHGIGAVHSETTACSIERARFLAEAEKAVATPPPHEVVDSSVIVPADIVRTRASISRQGPPLTGGYVMPLPPQRQRRHTNVHQHTQPRGGDAENTAIVLVDCHAWK